MKVLIFSLLLGVLSGVFADNSKTLSEMEIARIETVVLPVALEKKDVGTISTAAISFLQTSQSPDYSGDKNTLRDRARELLLICAENGDVVTSLLIVTSQKESDPQISVDMAGKLYDSIRNNPQATNSAEYQSVMVLYIATILDTFYDNEKLLNKGLEVAMSLQQSNEVEFYIAFLFNALGADDLADAYLNNACHNAEPNSKIYKFCANSMNIEREDALKVKVSNPDCNADIGKRCR